MRICIVLAFCAVAAFIGQTNGTRRVGPRGSLRPCTTAACRGDYINADTNAEAYGDFTDSFGNSNVEVDSYGGTRGRYSHGARGQGRGHTGARSSGRINSGNRYGGSTIGSSATADAFGTHSSLSETQGYGESYNGRGRAGASSVTAGSGVGYSRARTSASAGQGYRHKRSVDIDAGTGAEAQGHFTDTFGNSEVNAGTWGASGHVRHGARGQGVDYTAAKSGGGITATHMFGQESVGSDARAQAYGNMGSYSETRGDADFLNGHMRGSAGSRAGSSGFGESLSKTSASASGIRHKRHAGRRSCRYYGTCGSSMSAGTNADATGRFTSSFGNSDVQTDNFGSRGRVSFGSRGSGSGFTSSNSGGEIRTSGPYGGSSIGADANARAFGNMGSFSETSGNAESHNGYGSSGSQATAGSTGFGLSRSGTRASAGGRRYRRSANGRLCIMGRCYESVDTRTGGSAQGDLTESFGDSAISVQNGNLRALATHESTGRGYGRTGAISRGQIDSETQYGFESVGSAGRADAFGENSLSWTSSRTEKLNGASRTDTQSRGSASGRGRSAARSEAVATRRG